MSDEAQSDAVRLALLERDLKDQREQGQRLLKAVEESNSLLKRATTQPPTVELHDGSIHAACPQCGTARDVALPPMEVPQPDFDTVLSYLDAPHKEANGKGVNDCPSCAPKFRSKLEALGYVPRPVPSPEE